MKVGFIGLGAMGLPMARRVVHAGFPAVTTYHNRREPADELAALGASVVSKPADVARAADVVLTIVPEGADLKEVALGPGGLCEGFSAGKALIDMTSATPAALRDVEEKLRFAGVEVLDAPVSGGTTGAVNGTLTMMVGGDSAVLERYRPLLERMAQRIVHVGAIGQGKVIKMINQMLAAVHVMVIGEAFALGTRCGADLDVMYRVLKESSGYSRMMDLRLPDFLLRGSFEPGFKLDLMKKDVQIALESAHTEGVPLLFGSLAAQVFTAASVAGHGKEDFSRAADFLAASAGISFSKAEPLTSAAGCH